MLKNVHLKNLALITEADIDFESGLNILTGETGSGKSIIINSINIALGGKANKGLIRTGCQYGLVELLFVVQDESILGILDDLGISRDGNNISITRRITQDSTISKINGENATLTAIKQVTSRLIDIHGQHDHQSLLDPAKHLDIIDDFGGHDINILKSGVSREYENYKAIRKIILSFNMTDEELEDEKKRILEEMDEIESAALKPGEDAELEAEYKQISAWERIADSLHKAHSSINEEDDGAYSKISSALAEVDRAIEINPDSEELKSFKSTLADLESISKDLGQELERYINTNSMNESRSEAVKGRLNAIFKLKDKYGDTIEDVLGYYDSASERYNELCEYESHREELQVKLEDSRREINRLAHELSDKRREAGKSLSVSITDALKDLNFLNAEFEVNIEKLQKISANGFDKAEFLISFNPGEAPKPLSRVASGGELSRVMLAIKSQVAEKDKMPTLIFDEIDTGISGSTAYKVSEKMYELSKDHQIICITHLPQIAAMADHHYRIHKEVSDGTTISGIELLSREKEIEAIAGLVSGQTITEASIKNASELKESADAKKKIL